jgi:hypothetical protein
VTDTTRIIVKVSLRQWSEPRLWGGDLPRPPVRKSSIAAGAPELEAEYYNLHRSQRAFPQRKATPEFEHVSIVHGRGKTAPALAAEITLGCDKLN